MSEGRRLLRWFGRMLADVERVHHGFFPGCWRTGLPVRQSPRSLEGVLASFPSSDVESVRRRRDELPASSFRSASSGASPGWVSNPSMSTDSGFGPMTSHRNFSQQVVCEAPASWTFGCERAHASAGFRPRGQQAPCARMTSPGLGREQSAEGHNSGSASLSTQPRL